MQTGDEYFPSRTSLFVEMRAIKSCGESRNAHILGMSCQCTLQPFPEPSPYMSKGVKGKQERKQINNLMTIIIFSEYSIYLTSRQFTHLQLLDVRFVFTSCIIYHSLR